MRLLCCAISPQTRPSTGLLPLRPTRLKNQGKNTMPDTTSQATERPANDEMMQGFTDGYDLSAPEPSANRSRSYRHGFANGRDDKRGTPRASAAELSRMADLAMEADDAR